jgi:hypothetical protein
MFLARFQAFSIVLHRFKSAGKVGNETIFDGYRHLIYKVCNNDITCALFLFPDNERKQGTIRHASLDVLHWHLESHELIS